MPTIAPCLWFDDQAEQAAAHYTAIFPNSAILDTSHYPPDSPGPEGTVMVVEFRLDGQAMMALNGGPAFSFSEAISLRVDCADQDEIDHYWSRLGDGGEEGPCGWLKDRFGVSWQIVPTAIAELLAGSDRARAERALKAVWTMRKLDLAAILRAADATADTVADE